MSPPNRPIQYDPHSIPLLHLRKDLSKEDLLEIHTALNAWQWDYRLGPKPDGFDLLSRDEKQRAIEPYRLQLYELLSTYDRLKHWNISGMSGCILSEAEFDEFFTTHMMEILSSHHIPKDVRKEAPSLKNTVSLSRDGTLTINGTPVHRVESLAVNSLDPFDGIVTIRFRVDQIQLDYECVSVKRTSTQIQKEPKPSVCIGSPSC